MKFPIDISNFLWDIVILVVTDFTPYSGSSKSTNKETVTN